ncbi:hypothetical protein GCM10009634_82280 [Saccharothrix xinjiangensis]
MVDSWTQAPAGSTGAGGSAPELWPEEQAYVMAGPGRAAEVALVSLVDAGAVRISREGVVSPVHRAGRLWSPLQTRVLRVIPMPMGTAIAATAAGAEAKAMRQDLIARGYLTPPGRQVAMRRLRWFLLLAASAALVLTIALDLPFAVTAAVAVVALVGSTATSRAGRPLTSAGLAAARRLRLAATDAERRLNGTPTRPKSAPAWMAVSTLSAADRLVLLACHGLLGRIGRRNVWEVLGVEPAAAKTLRRRKRTSGGGGGSSCSGGCGSCSGSNCGGGGDSGSSSGGSSCGGGGGGCGGGGGGD